MTVKKDCHFGCPLSSFLERGRGVGASLQRILPSSYLASKGTIGSVPRRFTNALRIKIDWKATYTLLFTQTVCDRAKIDWKATHTLLFTQTVCDRAKNRNESDLSHDPADMLEFNGDGRRESNGQPCRNLRNWPPPKDE
jgi:hypothetical protein